METLEGGRWIFVFGNLDNPASVVGIGKLSVGVAYDYDKLFFNLGFFFFFGLLSFRFKIDVLDNLRNFLSVNIGALEDDLNKFQIDFSHNCERIEERAVV